MPTEGRIVPIAGRLRDFTRPTKSSAAATIAPVLPAERNASASLWRSISMPRTIDESRFVRTACAGASPISMACVVWKTRMRPGSSAAVLAAISRRMATSSPSRTISSSGQARDASTAPRTISRGAKSPPMASTAMRMGRVPPERASADR